MRRVMEFLEVIGGMVTVLVFVMAAIFVGFSLFDLVTIHEQACGWG